jgi:hypothetical protein
MLSADSNRPLIIDLPEVQVVVRFSLPSHSQQRTRSVNDSSARAVE